LKRSILFIFIAVAIINSGCILPALDDSLTIEPVIEAHDVYYAYMNGPYTYRIPSMVVTDRGTIITVCDARLFLWDDDSCKTDLVMRRSLDYGKTWTPAKLLLYYPGCDGIKDSSMVVDRETNTVWVLTTYFPEGSKQAGAKAQILAINSEDDGMTWSEPVNLNKQFSYPVPETLRVTGGTGIQMRDGTLVVPGPGPSIYFSTNHGKSWEFRKMQEAIGGETELVELNDGSLMLNTRSSVGYRKVSVTPDLGQTWTNVWIDEQLPDPSCNVGFIRYSSVLDGDEKDRILFSNLPVSTIDDRRDLTVRISYDEGRTWPVSKQIYDGFSAYSSMAVLPDGSICVLFERCNYTIISFVRFTLEALTDGQDRIFKVYL
jgi:Neuraminidase (sialidase)